MQSPLPDRHIRAWRADDRTPPRHVALAAAFAAIEGDATRLQRALRIERRLARAGDRAYDCGRHLALVAVAKPKPARAAAPPRPSPAHAAE